MYAARPLVRLFRRPQFMRRPIFHRSGLKRHASSTFILAHSQNHPRWISYMAPRRRTLLDPVKEAYKAVLNDNDPDLVVLASVTSDALKDCVWNVKNAGPKNYSNATGALTSQSSQLPVLARLVGIIQHAEAAPTGNLESTSEATRKVRTYSCCMNDYI